MGYYDGNPPGLRNAVSLDVDNASDHFAAAFDEKKLYAIQGDVPFWYKWAVVGGSVAVGAADAIFVPSGRIRYDSPPDGDKVYLHILRSGAVSGYVNVAVVAGPIGL